MSVIIGKVETFPDAKAEMMEEMSRHDDRCETCAVWSRSPLDRNLGVCFLKQTTISGFCSYKMLYESRYFNEHACEFYAETIERAEQWKF